MNRAAWEAVIGLEVHAELKTKSKIFCSCATDFGAPANTNVCPVCMGLPGAMPSLNRHAVELAIRAGLALECTVSPYSKIDRKQYFYPDLPKGYQISQDTEPLCRNGSVRFMLDGEEHRVGITRIHIEEDAGKLIHRGDRTLIDFNRCGVGLIEIVSEPTIRSAPEAATYLRTLRDVLLACGVSDCRMQEGSLRCDVNVSVRPTGSQSMGTRSEIKNINSFSFVEKAISYEIDRQIEVLERGEKLQSETRRYDEVQGKTVRMRLKETSVDYRFLPEPDLPMIRVREDELTAIAATLPELPQARRTRLAREYGLTEYDATVLVSDAGLADYFEASVKDCAYPKICANLLLSDLLRVCESDPFSSPVSATRLGTLSSLLGEGVINSATAKKLLARLIAEDFDPSEAVTREDLAQIRDPEQLRSLVDEILRENPRAVADYRSGKIAALRALQGRAMAKTGGRADPVLTEQLLQTALAPKKESEDA